MSTPPPYTPTFKPAYQSTHKRARLVRILLVVGAVLSVFALLFAVVEYSFGLMANFDEDAPEPAAIVIGLFVIGIALLEFAVYVATVVLFLMWLYRSHKNLEAFGVPKREIEYSSGWAVGSFFVPIVMLIIPYRAVREVWRKSVPNQSSMFRDLSPPAIFPLWWTAWLVAGFANQIYLRMMFRTDLSPESDLTLGVATSVLDIIAAVFAILVVTEIDKQQTASAELIRPGNETLLPPMPPYAFGPVTP